jgi:hypothetical protein
MSFLYVRHKVQNFDKWKPIYDNNKPERNKAGLTEKHVFRDSDDPSEVTLLFETTDDTKAKAFVTSDDLREAMKEAGVVGKPEIHFLRSAK